MAHDIFLKIDGIDGESPDAQHKNEIQVLNWKWGITQESSMQSGSGLGTGRATVHDLEFEHYIDRASPNLMKYCLSGKHIPEAKLVMRKAGGTPLEYLKLTLNDSSVMPAGSSTDEQNPREMVRLSFSRVKQEYVVQNQQGGSGGTVTAEHDIKANK